MSDIEHNAPSGVDQEPPKRSGEDRELAEQLVAEANEKGLDLVGPNRCCPDSPSGCSRRVLKRR